MDGFLGEMIGQAQRDGYTGFRIAGEMTWVLESDLKVGDLVEYESKLNEFFAIHEAFAIRQYNRQRFDPDTLLKIIPTHPFIAHGISISDNPHYDSPEGQVRFRSVPGAALE
jgi:hypothetical protein